MTVKCCTEPLSELPGAWEAQARTARRPRRLGRPERSAARPATARRTPPAARSDHMLQGADMGGESGGSASASHREAAPPAAALPRVMWRWWECNNCAIAGNATCASGSGSGSSSGCGSGQRWLACWTGMVGPLMQQPM